LVHHAEGQGGHLTHVVHELEVMARWYSQIRASEIHRVCVSVQVAHRGDRRRRIDDAPRQLGRVEGPRLCRDVGGWEVEPRIRVHALLMLVGDDDAAAVVEEAVDDHPVETGQRLELRGGRVDQLVGVRDRREAVDRVERASDRRAGIVARGLNLHQQVAGMRVDGYVVRGAVEEDRCLASRALANRARQVGVRALERQSKPIHAVRADRGDHTTHRRDAEDHAQALHLVDGVQRDQRALARAPTLIVAEVGAGRGAVHRVRCGLHGVLPRSALICGQSVGTCSHARGATSTCAR